MTRSSSVRVIAALVLSIAVTVAGVLVTRMSASTTNELSEPHASTEPTHWVEISPVTVGSITDSIQAVGTLQAVASIIVRPEIAGLVRRIHFADGQFVEQAAPLIELDCEELQAQANQAAAQERIAQVTYDRLKRLSSQHTTIVPVQQVDESRLTLEAAVANSVLYATRLKKTVIRAPFSGTVGLRRVSVGDYVQPGQDIVNLEDLHTLHVEFQVPEVWLSRLVMGQRLLVTTEAFPDSTFEGHLSAIDPRVDSLNRTVAVRAEVLNPDGRLRPGLFTTVRLAVGVDSQALLIPEESVLVQRHKPMVFRVTEQTARLTEVVLGVRDRGLVQVRGGLKAGDYVVRGGTHKLHDGLRVSIKSSK